MATDVAALRQMCAELKEKATPIGPVNWRCYDIYGPNYGEVFGPAGNDSDTVLRFHNADHAHYVAQVSPANILRLVEMVEAVCDERGECLWIEDEEGTWNSACGDAFQFTVDGPSENDMKFCPYCGKTLIEKKYEAEDAND